MCNYCGTKHHRKIYENHHGPIPKDNEGRSYDIHHIDGVHSNNDPNNLKALSIREHYDIHYQQKDYGACMALLKRMRVTPQERSDLARLQQLKRSEDGTHNFKRGEISRRVAKERVENGTHNFLGGELQRKRVREGSHPFLNGDLQRKTQAKLISEGRHHLCKTGLEHPKTDHTIYSLVNTVSGITQSGTRKELIKSCGLTDNAVSRLIKRRNKTQLNWKLV